MQPQGCSIEHNSWSSMLNLCALHVHVDLCLLLMYYYISRMIQRNHLSRTILMSELTKCSSDGLHTMMPRYSMHTAATRHGYGRDTGFTHKSEVSNMIRHDALPNLKYPCIIIYMSSLPVKIQWSWLMLDTYPSTCSRHISYIPLTTSFLDASSASCSSRALLSMRLEPFRERAF